MLESQRLLKHGIDAMNPIEFDTKTPLLYRIDAGNPAAGWQAGQLGSLFVEEERLGFETKDAPSLLHGRFVEMRLEGDGLFHWRWPGGGVEHWWGTLAKSSLRHVLTGNWREDSTRNGSFVAVWPSASVQFAHREGKMARAFGENYDAILQGSPIIQATLSRSRLFVENSELLSTVFNVPWATTLFWTAAAGTATLLRSSVGDILGELFHYAPGHVERWDAVNDWMDTVRGSGHRLKFGHSLEFLPEAVERFGIQGIPAFGLHLLQDFMTPAGIPVVINAWTVKEFVQRAMSLSPRIATSLVSLQFSTVLALVLAARAAFEWGKVVPKLVRSQKLKPLLKAARDCADQGDQRGAASNYEKALQVERRPEVLIALGQTYLQKAANRLRAHKAFVEALDLLAGHPHITIDLGSAAVSLRGYAGIHALATADVLGGIHPEHWRDHVDALVTATVTSFSGTAVDLAEKPIVKFARPPHLTAAINYYLAAQAAAQYPLAEDRYDAQKYYRSARRCLRLVAEYDKPFLKQPMRDLDELWRRELLPPQG